MSTVIAFQSWAGPIPERWHAFYVRVTGKESEDQGL